VRVVWIPRRPVTCLLTCAAMTIHPVVAQQTAADGSRLDVPFQDSRYHHAATTLFARRALTSRMGG
jgi:hypothetical protein